MSIDHKKMVQRLLAIADRYAIERSRTKSVTRTIAKAKQEAILEVIDIVNGMEKMPVYIVDRTAAQRDHPSHSP